MAETQNKQNHRACRERIRISGDYAVSHGQTTGWAMPGIHCHDMHEVLWILGGVRHVFVNGRTYAGESNTLFVFNSTDLHHCIPDLSACYERRMVVFDPLYAGRLSSEETDLLACFRETERKRLQIPPCVSLNEEQAAAMAVLYDQANEACRDRGYGADLLRQSAFCKLMTCISRLFLSARTTGEDEKTVYPAGFEERDSGLVRIRPALQHIESHLQENLPRHALAKRCFLSVRHFSTLFFQATGFTVHEYITAQRIRRARQLLEQGCSVTETAGLCGSSDISHFGRTFRKITGWTPQAYARASRKARVPQKSAGQKVFQTNTTTGGI